MPNCKVCNQEPFCIRPATMMCPACEDVTDTINDPDHLMLIVTYLRREIGNQSVEN